MDFNTFGQELETIIDYLKSNSYNVVVNIGRTYTTSDCPYISQSTRYYSSREGINTLGNIETRCSYNPAGIAIFVSKNFVPNNIKVFKDYIAYEMLRRKTSRREDVKENWSISASIGFNIFKTPENDKIKWQKVKCEYNSASHKAIYVIGPETTDISELFYYIQTEIEKNVKTNLEKTLGDYKNRDYPAKIKRLQDKQKLQSTDNRQRNRIIDLLSDNFMKNFDICRDISDYWLDDVIADKAIDEINETIDEYESDGRNVDDWDPDTIHDNYLWSFTEWLDKEYAGLIYKFAEEELTDEQLPVNLEVMQDWYYEVGDHSLPDEDDFPYPDDDD